MSRTTTFNQHINQSYIMTLNGKLKYLQLFEIPSFTTIAQDIANYSKLIQGKTKTCLEKIIRRHFLYIGHSSKLT